jgi:hypothetical protein
MIKWIENSKGNRYSFVSKFHLPLLAYCNDIVLLGSSFSDINSVFGKLVQYYTVHNLDINQAKSGYTSNSGNGRHNIWYKGVLITKLEPHNHYKYLGIWFSLTLNWSVQMTAVECKVQALLATIRKKHIMPDQMVAVLNMAAVAVVAYSMLVVQFPGEWLNCMDTLMVQVVHSQMGLSPRYNLEPFFISVEKGGAGLNSLLGLMKVYQ